MPIRPLPILALALAAACGGGGGPTEPPPPPTPQANCDAPAVVNLSVGAHVVLDPATSAGCVRFPTVSVSAEYLVSIVSGAGSVTQNGVSGPYFVRASGPASAAPPASPSAGFPFPVPVSAAEEFHLNLRRLERELGADPANRPSALALSPRVQLAPAVGHERRFSVCKNLQCNQFDSVTAVARYVGLKTAVYIDKNPPSTDTLFQSDINDLGRTFDTFHHPIAINAFGTESDLDANGVIVILLTKAVNALTPDCTNGRILGYFWGGDLLTISGSNRAEIFYGMVPSPATSQCTAATRKQTVDRLKPTMIHEVQHMINYNQHVLVRTGQSEATWLNEALSHFAEELGGRLIPAAECTAAGFTSCRSQYISGNLTNAYDYLGDSEASFLVTPSSSTVTLKERGAGWLFMRWLADQFGTDSVGTNLTRAMTQTTLTGTANVQGATGQQFPGLVAEWLLASYADDLPELVAASPRMTYTSWGLRSVFQANCCTPNAVFAKAFPTDPLVVGTSFTHTGTLRGGSGRHFLVVRAGGAAPLDFLLARNATAQGLDPTLQTRVGVLRLR